MSMNTTPKGERIHIALFGRRNAGKSSLINAITGQDLAIVSDVLGTTTDPVYKAMEILPLGPVMLIDTPGLDDEGVLGEERIKKARSVLNKTDLALIVADGNEAAKDFSFEHQILALTKKKNIPSIVVLNKQDLWAENEAAIQAYGDLCVSSKTGYHIHELKELMTTKLPTDDQTGKIVGDLLSPLDFVVLVVPIDSAAPKGRLILPQQQTIRDILERGALSLVVRDTELKSTLDHFLAQGACPKLVVTDSQAFARVSKDVPENITLTSFSILFSRYKGELEIQLKGIAALSSIEDGDRILIAEGCTHHRQCGDIGTCKMPEWIRNYTGKKPVFEFTSGTEFPDDVSSYKMVVHCGGCMLNEREMKYRIACCQDQGVPITNYGILIAQVTGILKRSLGPFPEMQKLI